MFSFLKKKVLVSAALAVSLSVPFAALAAPVGQRTEYADFLAVNQQGADWVGRKMVNVSENSASAVDYVNGVSMGGGALISWHDVVSNWFGETTSSVEYIGNVKTTKINGTFSGRGATATTSARVDAEDAGRDITGTIRYTVGTLVLNGTIAGSGIVTKDLQRMHYSVSFISKDKRFSVDFDYSVNGREVSGRFFAVDAVGGQTFGENLFYISDEPNFIRDVDMVAQIFEDWK